jgi:hypothetical protein
MIICSARRWRIALALGAALVLGNFVGCNTGKALSLQEVRGSVRYRGKLLDHGRVVFMPVQGTPGPPAVGEIQPDGSFRMQTDEEEGASQGRHHVLVQCRQSPAPSAKPQMTLLKSLIPEKYANDASPLYYEVKPGKNEYPISLE